MSIEQENVIEHKTIEIHHAGRVFVYDSEKITYEQSQRVRAIVAHAAELLEKPPATVGAFETCGLDTWKLRALSHIFVEKIGEIYTEYSPEKARNTSLFIKKYSGNFAPLEEAIEHFLEHAGASSLASLVLRRDTLLLLQKYARMAMPAMNSSAGSNTDSEEDTRQTTGES